MLPVSYNKNVYFVITSIRINQNKYREQWTNCVVITDSAK